MNLSGPLSALVLASVAWSAIGSVPARADESPSRYVELRWNAPADCPERSTVLRAIDAQLGAGFATDTRIRASADVIEHDAGNYELLIDYTTDAGTHDERRILGESCADAADAAALVLTLALNPSPLEAKPAPAAQPSPSVVPQTPPATQQPAAVARKSEPATERSTRTWSVGALAVLDTAVMSRSTVGAGLRLGWSLDSLQLSVAARYLLPREITYGAIDTRLSFWSVELGACYLARWTAVALGPCADFEMGSLAGAAHGAIAAAHSGAARLQSTRVGAEVRVRMYARLWLAVTAAGEWIGRRPQFVVEDIGTVSSPALFGARVEVGPLLVW